MHGPPAEADEEEAESEVPPYNGPHFFPLHWLTGTCVLSLEEGGGGRRRLRSAPRPTFRTAKSCMLLPYTNTPPNPNPYTLTAHSYFVLISIWW